MLKQLGCWVESLYGYDKEQDSIPDQIKETRIRDSWSESTHHSETPSSDVLQMPYASYWKSGVMCPIMDSPRNPAAIDVQLVPKYLQPLRRAVNAASHNRTHFRYCRLDRSGYKKHVSGGREPQDPRSYTCLIRL